MANSDKNILITPNTGSTTLNPTIKFTGANNTPLTLRTLDTGTVSFEGTAGQLFSISDGLSGTIFSVNDISGIPSIEVLDTGLIKLAQYNGQVTIGSSTNNATTTVTGSTTFNTSATGFVKHASVIAPTADMFQVTNAGFPNITAGVSAMQVNYVGGAAAIEASASRVDITPGTTTGGTWNGFRVVPTTSAASGVVYNAMKFDSVTAGAGTDNILYVGTGYDNILNYNGTSIISGTGLLNLASVTGTLAIANGGTGATTAMTAATALLPSQTSNSGKYLTTDGLGTLSWGTVSGYSAPTIGSTSIGSGATVTTIAGLTLTSPTISTITNTGTLTLPTTTGTLALTSQTFYIGTQAIAINAGTGTITSLPGVTSVNGTTIPSSATLLTSATGAAIGQTMYIGTTGVAINRATADLALAGITSITGTSTLTLNSTTTSALSLDSTTTGAINIGTNANAKTITIGNVTGATGLVVNTGTGGTLFNTLAGSYVKVAKTVAPTVDMVQITNTGFPNVTAGISALQVNYVGGAVAVEATAARVDITPGTTTGGTWNGFRVVPTTSAASGVVYNAMKFDTVTAGLGTDNIIYVGTGYDNIINYNGTSIISGTGLLNLASVTGTLAATNGGTAQSTYATGDIVYASAANTLAKRTIGTTGQVLTVAGGIPTWATATSTGADVIMSIMGAY